MDEAEPAERWPCTDDPVASLAVRRTVGRQAFMPTILFLGGFHSSMAGRKARFVADLAVERGWSAVRFDYRGHGEADGRFADHTLHHWLADALTVLDGIEGPVLLVGSSMGAWLGLHVVRRRPARVVALLTLAAAPDFTERLMRPALDAHQRAALAAGESTELRSAHAEDGEPPWTIREPLFASGRELALLDGPTRIALAIPVRAIHGIRDRDVPWSFSLDLIERIDSHDSSLLLLPHGDHRLSDPLSLGHIAATLGLLMTLVAAGDMQAADRERHA